MVDLSSLIPIVNISEPSCLHWNMYFATSKGWIRLVSWPGNLTRIVFAAMAGSDPLLSVHNSGNIHRNQKSSLWFVKVEEMFTRCMCLKRLWWLNLNASELIRGKLRWSAYWRGKLENLQPWRIYPLCLIVLHIWALFALCNFFG